MRVTSVTPTVGATVMPGPVLAITSTAGQVEGRARRGAAGQCQVGDAVTITLPDNQTTPGRITYVSSVADRCPALVKAVKKRRADDRSRRHTDQPGGDGHLDQAPVNVSITIEGVENVLAVPVDALLALAGAWLRGGGRRRPRAPSGGVSLGLFDGADGLVQVSAKGCPASVGGATTS